MKQDKEVSKSNRYALYAFMVIFVASVLFIFFGENSNVDVNEMMKHVKTGEVPF